MKITDAYKTKPVNGALKNFQFLSPKHLVYNMYIMQCNVFQTFIKSHNCIFHTLIQLEMDISYAEDAINLILSLSLLCVVRHMFGLSLVSVQW